MGTTFRRIRTFVQKIAKIAAISDEETQLALDVVAGISKSGSCKISDIARAKGGEGELRKLTRPFYDGIARKKSGLERLREAWVRFVARVADKMPFIAVDFSDISKIHGKLFENLAIVRDASDPRKRKGPGFNTIQIEATDHQHRTLPLWHQIFSTLCPEYTGWYNIVGRAMAAVLEHVGKRAIWLFDRGFDAGDFYDILGTVGVRRWVVRQLQTRNVLLETGVTMLMSDLAASLRKPFDTVVPYVHKKTHELRYWPVSFNFVPLRLPDLPGRRCWMIVITGLRQDMVLLVNFKLQSPKQAERIVQAYLRRWAAEEGIRCWKQVTGVEDFRVRNWSAIRRLTFFSLLAYGIQAYCLLARPTMAKQLIARVKQFIAVVLFENYRLWAGVQDALLKGA
jgi:hypothetical protein